MKKTKKIVFFISLFFTVIFLLLAFTSDSIYDYCISEGHCSSWMDIIDSALPTLMLYFSVIILFLSSIIYFLKEEIFNSWIKFTYYWLPISIFLVFITPGGRGGGFFPSLIDKELISILMSGLFFIISLLLIIFKFIQIYLVKK